VAIQRVIRKVRDGLLRLKQRQRIQSISRYLQSSAEYDPQQSPVIFFNASTRLEGLSQNAAFALIASWGLQASRVPVIHFGCQSGMRQCVLGTALGKPLDPMPCKGCVRDTRLFTRAAPTVWFDYLQDQELSELVRNQGLDELRTLTYRDRPLGEFVLPSIRWALRRHDLVDDADTRQVYRNMILSAHSAAEQFTELLERVTPQAVVVFNGLQFPERTVKWVAEERGIRVITHEVSYQPLSAFFTDGQATSYPIAIPEGFQLDEEQNQSIDNYMNERMQGKFTMAGVRFWPEMQPLEDSLEGKLEAFHQVVAVFTNVVFDTSQARANTIFSDMFDWLGEVLRLARERRDTLFVVRAHPDEMRPGKESRQSVAGWMDQKLGDHDHNVLFIDSSQPLSSYELMERAHFIMVYNSSIGLEASLLGVPVLCAGKARYTQYPIVFYPSSRGEFRDKAIEMLQDDAVEVPALWRENARRFLYFQLFRVSLPFKDYLREHPYPGFVQLRDFSKQLLFPDHSQTLRVLRDGIIDGEPFMIPESET